jgi:hypothetical protein
VGFVLRDLPLRRLPQTLPQDFHHGTELFAVDDEGDLLTATRGKETLVAIEPETHLAIDALG